MKKLENSCDKYDVKADFAKLEHLVDCKQDEIVHLQKQLAHQIQLRVMLGDAMLERDIKVAELEKTKESNLHLLGEIVGTIPLAKITNVAANGKTLVEYFKKLHEEFADLRRKLEAAEQLAAHRSKSIDDLLTHIQQLQLVLQKFKRENPDIEFPPFMFADQCLAEVQAQAIREFARKLISVTKATDFKGKIVRTELKGAIEICVQEINEANQLRQQAKAGEQCE